MKTLPRMGLSSFGEHLPLGVQRLPLRLSAQAVLHVPFPHVLVVSLVPTRICPSGESALLGSTSALSLGVIVCPNCCCDLSKQRELKQVLNDSLGVGMITIEKPFRQLSVK